MNILIINGPNLNLLGLREPDVYGNETYHELKNTILKYAKNKQISVKIYQSNHEGKIIDLMQNKYQKFDGIIINPGAFTHYSYAIRDCLAALPIPKVEVHLSNIKNRESFRKLSVIEDVVDTSIIGKGFNGYLEAIDFLLNM